MTEFAIPARVDVAGGAPRMADLRRPVPGLVVAPLAHAEQHRPPGATDGVAHGGVGAARVQALAVAPVVLDVVEAPAGVVDGVLVLVATAARASTAGGRADVRINAQLEP